MSHAKAFAALIACFTTFSLAQEQSTGYILSEFPLAPIAPRDAVWIKWTGFSSDPITFIPDSAKIYYGKDPGGSVIENYTDSITVFARDSSYVGMSAEGDSLFDYTYQRNIAIPGDIPMRGNKFSPSDQPDMGPGTYYYIAGWRGKVGLPMQGRDTVLVSNELTMIVRSDAVVEPKEPASGAVITDLTPTFHWKRNPGVPYYHIIVSDEKIDATEITDFDNLELSIVWQAITSNTYITYGAPDPSGTITADPPPISPEMEYSWAVINNYGNHPALSVGVPYPSTFVVAGEKLETPVNIAPNDGDTVRAAPDEPLHLTWTNLDSNANTYQVYVYVASDIEGINAQLVVWNTEVTAGNFSGDTASIAVDAYQTFTNNKYTWRVIAVDRKGAGTAGGLSEFQYRGVRQGHLVVRAREKIRTGDTTYIESPVSLAEVEVEVLDGSMEAPLLFYTDNNGVLKRDRPVGEYRLTIHKDGFQPATRTVAVGYDELTGPETTMVTMYLDRPDATMYGKVVDDAGEPVDLAGVFAVSDYGDTISDQCDASGNFVLSCRQADWNVWATKKGYVSSVPKDVSVNFGQSVSLGAISIKRNPLSLSGIVRNTDGAAILGARVRISKDGKLVEEVPSTSQTGAFSFQVSPGEYVLEVSKIGFESRRSDIAVLSSKQVTVKLSPGAALIQGSIYGEHWSNNDSLIRGPITNARVFLIDTNATPPDTIKSSTGSTYGNFQMSIGLNKEYILKGFASDYHAVRTPKFIRATKDSTYSLSDTLKAYARLSGTTKDSSGNSPLGHVSIALINQADGTVVANGRSDAQGSFEIRGIPDGALVISAGKEGYFVDRTLLWYGDNARFNDSTLLVENGRVLHAPENEPIRTVGIHLVPGTKTLSWTARNGSVDISNASVKISTPFQKRIQISDMLNNVGTGVYLLGIDADDPAIVDLARHVTNVTTEDPDTVSDRISMPIVHRRPGDSLRTNDAGTIELLLHVLGATTLDTVLLHYKDIDSDIFQHINPTSSEPDGTDPVTGTQATVYSFEVLPPKDGSIMQYYFSAIIGQDEFGTSQETYTVYLYPDMSLLSRVEIVPSSQDTLVLSGDSRTSFSVRGYYGSNYVPATDMVDGDVVWRLSGARGCSLNEDGQTTATGVNVTLLAPAEGAPAFALIADIEDERVSPRAEDTSSVIIRVTNAILDSILVKQISGPAFLTTPRNEQAAFSAVGVDKNGTPVTVNPEWEIIPASVIDTILAQRGILLPNSRFAGYARIRAHVGSIVGEFNRKSEEDRDNSGIQVVHQISTDKDTITNGKGCTISLPQSSTGSLKDVQLAMGIPVLETRVEQRVGKYAIIGNSYDISVESISRRGFEINYDEDDSRSIELRMQIPELYLTDAEEGTGEFLVGYWNDDSLQWTIMPECELSEDNQSVVGTVKHLSRYAILFRQTGKPSRETWSITPNPFSPYIRPVPEFGLDARRGTAIEVTPKTETPTVDICMEVYTITGERVLTATEPQVESNRTYRFWWRGGTESDGYGEIERTPGNRKVYEIRGNALLRNGRYFMVLTIDDRKNRPTQYMKPIVILK